MTHVHAPRIWTAGCGAGGGTGRRGNGNASCSVSGRGRGRAGLVPAHKSGKTRLACRVGGSIDLMQRALALQAVPAPVPPRGACRCCVLECRLRGLRAQFTSNFPFLGGVRIYFQPQPSPGPHPGRSQLQLPRVSGCRFPVAGRTERQLCTAGPARAGQQPAMAAPLDARHKYIAARVGPFKGAAQRPAPCLAARDGPETALPIACCSWQRPMPTSRRRARSWQCGETKLR